MTSTKLTPTSSQERIISLDILRGIALLGILIINIQSFAMPGAAYLNPSSYGDLTGLNKWVWIVSFVLADSKMMALFSILFGAGVILVTERATSKSGKSAGLHYSRSFWLLVFGMIHAHLIWSGDILVTYAICAFIIYFFRNRTPRTLIIIGVVIIAVHSLVSIMAGLSIPSWPDDQLAEAMLDWAPEVETLNQEISEITGSLSSQIQINSSNATMMQTLVIPWVLFWRACGLMLIGMAFFKSGILAAQKSTSFYRKGMFIGWIIGFPLVCYGVYQNFAHNWTYEYSMFFGNQWNYWGSLGVSFGYICAIMLFIKSSGFDWLKQRLAAVGQMAFTNYITQSLICVFIFWGIGLSFFGQWERWQQFLIVLLVWAIQLWWSKPWLQNYKFGPLEWLWRSLAYRKWQPFKR